MATGAAAAAGGATTAGFLSGSGLSTLSTFFTPPAVEEGGGGWREATGFGGRMRGAAVVGLGGRREAGLGTGLPLMLVTPPTLPRTSGKGALRGGRATTGGAAGTPRDPLTTRPTPPGLPGWERGTREAADEAVREAGAVLLRFTGAGAAVTAAAGAGAGGAGGAGAEGGGAGGDMRGVLALGRLLGVPEVPVLVVRSTGGGGDTREFLRGGAAAEAESGRGADFTPEVDDRLAPDEEEEEEEEREGVEDLGAPISPIDASMAGSFLEAPPRLPPFFAIVV